MPFSCSRGPPRRLAADASPRPAPRLSAARAGLAAGGFRAGATAAGRRIVRRAARATTWLSASGAHAGSGPRAIRYRPASSSPPARFPAAYRRLRPVALSLSVSRARSSRPGRRPPARAPACRPSSSFSWATAAWARRPSSSATFPAVRRRGAPQNPVPASRRLTRAPVRPLLPTRLTIRLSSSSSPPPQSSRRSTWPRWAPRCTRWTSRRSTARSSSTCGA